MSNNNITKNNESIKKGFYSTLFTTFIAVFLAELGDKTQVATLLLSAETGKPKIVFIGAALALILSSLIGVVIGRIIALRIQPLIFNRLAAILMIIISFLMIYDVINSTNEIAYFN